MSDFHWRKTGLYYDLYDSKMSLIGTRFSKEDMDNRMRLLAKQAGMFVYSSGPVPNTVEPGSERMMPDHPEYKTFDQHAIELGVIADPSANPDSKLFKYPHYFKDVSNLTHIDIYRVCDLWGVTNPALQHAIKKLLVAGGRGAKNVKQDLTEAADAIDRALQMLHEDGTK